MNTLKQLRQNKGVLQKDVANYLGVDRTTYVKYERGDSEPNHDILLKLADYFNVSIDYLLGRKEKPPENNSDSLSRKIIEVFNHLDDDKQKTALEYLEFLASRDNPEK